MAVEGFVDLQLIAERERMQSDLRILLSNSHDDLAIEYWQEDLYTGYAKVGANIYDKELIWREFYPMDRPYIPNLQYYGTLTHATTAQALRYLYGDDFSVLHTGKVSHPREVQLGKMGIFLGIIVKTRCFFL